MGPSLQLILLWACTLLTVGFCATARAQETVVLRNDVWSIAISPRTLRVVGTPVGERAMEISAAREPSAIAQLTSDEHQASWTLADQGIAVSMMLVGDSLRVQFTAEKPGEFDWPVVPPDPSFRAYILPIWEGHYVPIDDADWIGRLSGEPLEVVGLSLPLWGIDCGNHTLTYHVTHPYNCELAFEKQVDKLQARLTHRFTRNWNVKQYDLIISLGGPSPIEPAQRYRRWLVEQGKFVSLKQKIAVTPGVEKLLGAAHVYLWGDGVSGDMIEKFSRAGLDRLWLGVDGKQGLKNHPEFVARAKELGYLIGYYDSYHSIHSPTQQDSWETAQFDQALFESGPIVRADGSRRPGFQHKGFTLSPIAARPYVEKRVAEDMRAMGANSLFMDCDAFGEVFDDYSPLHLATQADDIAARLSRMSWIEKTFGAVVGSEGGVWYSAPVIHFAHGMTTSGLGWGDKEMSDRASPYYLGAYFPPDQPAIFMKPVPLKESYIKLEIDPRYRLPLYQAAFHDSVVTSEHWSSATLKFSNVLRTRMLLELLYGTPPLYHMNLRQWEKDKELVGSQYTFFSPLHRRGAVLPMSEFEFLSADRSVQRTRFGEELEMIANFSKEGFVYQGMTIAPGSIVARRGGLVEVYSPAVNE